MSGTLRRLQEGVGCSKGGLEGDFEGDLDRDLERDLEGDLEGDSKGDFRGDFKQDMEGDSGQVQVWFSLQPKFNSFELNSEEERLVFLEAVIYLIFSQKCIIRNGIISENFSYCVVRRSFDNKRRLLK